MRHCGQCGCELTHENASLCERARVVGVLDAWEERTHAIWEMGTRLSGERTCTVGGTWFYGPTADAARAAAAKAIEAGEV